MSNNSDCKYIISSPIDPVASTIKAISKFFEEVQFAEIVAKLIPFENSKGFLIQ